MFEPKEEKVVLYAYVTEANFDWVERTRTKLKKKRSEFVNDMIESWKKEYLKHTRSRRVSNKR